MSNIWTLGAQGCLFWRLGARLMFDKDRLIFAFWKYRFCIRKFCFFYVLKEETEDYTKELKDVEGTVKRVNYIIQKQKLDWVLIFESVLSNYGIFTHGFVCFTSILDLFQTSALLHRDRTSSVNVKRGTETERGRGAWFLRKKYPHIFLHCFFFSFFLVESRACELLIVF